MMVDTLTIARELKAADLPASQADAIAAAIGRALGQADDAQSDVAKLAIEIKGEFAANTQRMEAMEQRLGAKIETMRSSLLIWLIGVILASAGLFVTISRLHL